MNMQPLQGSMVANQYQHQYTPQKSYQEILDDVSSSGKKDSITSELLTALSNQVGYPLTISSLFWNKYSKLRIKPWGGSVTDSTILINNKRMPIIRKANYSQTSWNVSIDTIPITIGNHIKNQQFPNKQVISLREYLSNINRYISTNEQDSDQADDDDKKQTENPNKPMRKVSLLSSTDNTIIMDTQCCFLPLNPLGVTQYNLATLNWKAGLKNPACLYIVSTNEGTSSVVIEGNFQKIYYNKNGMKAPFIIDSNNLQNDPNQCIKIIQVPLRQKTRKQIEQEQASNASWGITNWWSSGSERKRVFDVLPKNCKDVKVQQLLKNFGYHEIEDDQQQQILSEDKPVSRSGIKVIPSAAPKYCCTRYLVKSEAETCYGENNANITVSCDGCGGSYTGKDVIWHCPETISELHPNGYDLCDKCAQRQLIHDELRGLKGLRRDERYNIRVTLLYYKPIKGVINEHIITQIIQKLSKADNLGCVQPTQQINTQIAPVSPVNTPPNMYNPLPIRPQPIQPVRIQTNINIPKPVIKASDFRIITNALRELKLNAEFLKIFQNQNVTDSDLKLLNDNDLNILFPNSLGAKIRFRAWLKENNGKLLGENKNIDQNQYRVINNIFRSLNVVNVQKYILNFVNNNINDKMIGFLNDSDLEILIPDMSVRVLFRRTISNTPPQQPTINTMQQQQPASPKFLF